MGQIGSIMIGQTVGRYRILNKLGEGGMGSVWRAEDSVLQRQVALKLLSTALASDPLARRRFLREARSASYLDHPGIATVYDSGEADGQVYIAFQLVEGETVHDRVCRGPMEVGEALRVATAAADALQYAHQGGTRRRPVIHRDISGRNIMLAADGRTIIVDFGLARPEGQTRLTLTGTAMGTAGYMSPEVARGGQADGRSDLYGLGIVIYEMLTGRLPFAGENLAALLYATVHKQPEPPSAYRSDVPPDLDRVVLRALAKDPGRRHPSAAHLAADLRAVQRGEAVAAPVPQMSQMPTVMLPETPSGSEWGSWWRPGVRLASGLTIVVVLTLGTIAAYRWASSGAEAGSARNDRFAVLPLENASQDRQVEYLAVGLSRDLIDALSQLDTQVIPWLTVQRFAADERPMRAIADELGVGKLITGSVRMVGVMLQGKIGLIEAETGLQTWAYEYTDSEYLVVLKELVEALVSRLRPDMEESHIQAALRWKEPDPEAYKLFLKGAHAMEAISSGNAVGRELALRLFRKALEKDPDLPGAHVGIAAVHSQMYFSGSGTLEDMQQAEEHLRRALDLDPGLANGRAALVRVLWYQGRSEDCLRQGQLVAGLPRQQAPELLVRAQAYLLGGLADKAIPLLEKAIELDPASQAAHWFLPLSLHWSGRYEAAVQAGQQYLDRFGDDVEIHTWLGAARNRLGDREGARVHYERALASPGAGTALYARAMAGHFFAAAGERDRAIQIWSEGARLAGERVGHAGANPRLATTAASLAGLAGDEKGMEDLLAAVREARQVNESMPEMGFTLAHLGQTSRALDLLVELQLRGLHLGVRIHQIDAFGAQALRAHPRFPELMEMVQVRGRELRALY